ncbi:RTA1 domain protein, putative [Metarhizium acridum CQMa 102]|uniref:RTA1 domain protein, putative n=1 Tax=Metarhizium acridum (strain CQMa 102) TaxID=655827 RepID=E9DV42_METAQ|nr:RTA1 domain protein, putative [Metarhizium acridum CQMa 102]EFY92466.1 RTA1 domain protein, putative [Metarhizium acridum CQMa 102]
MSNSTGHRVSMNRCTEVSALCPVDETVLGYYPNLGSGIFFSIAFGICLIAAFSLGMWKKTWTYTAAITIGLILETAGMYLKPPREMPSDIPLVRHDHLFPLRTEQPHGQHTFIVQTGYVGRILLHYNPWNESAFELQICAIILAPTFVCVSIYLTLKHAALHLNPRLSRIPPRWYPRIFLPADLSCLIVQAIGGGIAAAAGHTKPRLQEDGNRAIIAGVVLQVLVLAVFGAMGTDYFARAARHVRTAEATPAELALWRDSKFRAFVLGVTGAYVAVLVRCIYRIAEMAGGWGNKIMQDEPSFLVLDSSLILVTVYLLTIFHPGIFFPQMANGHRNKNGAAAAAAVSDAESSETKANDSPDSPNEGQKTESGH